MKIGQGAGGFQHFSFLEFNSSLVQEFKFFFSLGFRSFSGFWHFAITAWELSVNQSSSGEKNCVVYSLFCIFIIIIGIIITISSSSIYFVVVLNCLHLNP